MKKKLLVSQAESGVSTKKREKPKAHASKAIPQAAQGSLRTCRKGHEYLKSSACPTCPTCEAAKKPSSGFLSSIGAPARRALENAGITTLTKLAKRSKREILALHGMGPSSIPKLEQALKEQGLQFAGAEK